MLRGERQKRTQKINQAKWHTKKTARTVEVEVWLQARRLQ
jgi:hypothetical protein